VVCPEWTMVVTLHVTVRVTGWSLAVMRALAQAMRRLFSAGFSSSAPSKSGSLAMRIWLFATIQGQFLGLLNSASRLMVTIIRLVGACLESVHVGVAAAEIGEGVVALKKKIYRIMIATRLGVSLRMMTSW